MISTDCHDEHKHKDCTVLRSNNFAQKMSVKMRIKLYVLETIHTTARSPLKCLNVPKHKSKLYVAYKHSAKTISR